MRSSTDCHLYFDILGCRMNIYVLSHCFIFPSCFRLPNFSLPCAIDVLTTGTYSRLPTCIRVSQF